MKIHIEREPDIAHAMTDLTGKLHLANPVKVAVVHLLIEVEGEKYDCVLSRSEAAELADGLVGCLCDA